LLQLYGAALPAIANASGGAINPLSTSLASGAAAANPILSGSTLNQLSSMGTDYAATGANISNTNDLLNSGILGSGGAVLNNAAGNLLANSNPAQNAANSQATNLVNSINLNGLTGGEQEAVERSLNQNLNGTGNLGLNNATNAVSNAMNFGSALQAKRAALGSALGTAVGVSGQQNVNFNPVNTALSNPSNTNFGLTQFNPSAGNNLPTTGLGYLSSIFSPLSSNASSQNSKSSSNSSSLGINVASGGGGGGCYLTAACCKYKGLQDDCIELRTLRAFRDLFVSFEDIDEYYKKAPTIVDSLTPARLQEIYVVIQGCVKDIQNSLYNSAYNRYKNMMKGLLCQV
jgi:hypothetical protein